MSDTPLEPNIQLAGHMHLSEIVFKLYVFVYNYSSVKPQEGGLIVTLLGTPLLADPVDKYAKMSRKKHLFKLLHKLHNWLRHVCEINMETAKHGRNRQHHNSLNSTSWLRLWGYKVENDFSG